MRWIQKCTTYIGLLLWGYLIPVGENPVKNYIYTAIAKSRTRHCARKERQYRKYDKQVRPLGLAMHTRILRRGILVRKVARR